MLEQPAFWMRSRDLLPLATRADRNRRAVSVIHHVATTVWRQQERGDIRCPAELCADIEWRQFNTRGGRCDSRPWLEASEEQLAATLNIIPATAGAAHKKWIHAA